MWEKERERERERERQYHPQKDQSGKGISNELVSLQYLKRGGGDGPSCL